MKNRIAVLTGLLVVSSILSLVLLFSIYQKIDIFPAQKAVGEENLQAVNDLFYTIFLSTAVVITSAVMLLKSYNKRHALEAVRRAKSSVRVGTLGKRINDILKSVNDPFFAVDRSYNFLYLNSLAENQFGAGSGDLLHENYKERFANAGEDIISEKMDEVMRSRKPVSFEAKNYKGEWKCFSICPTSEGISVQTKDAAASKQFEEQLINK